MMITAKKIETMWVLSGTTISWRVRRLSQDRPILRRMIIVMDVYKDGQLSETLERDYYWITLIGPRKYRIEEIKRSLIKQRYKGTKREDRSEKILRETKLIK